MELQSDFVFRGLPPIVNPVVSATLAPAPNPLGPLANLVGTFTGTGFNMIWRPDQAQDHFLELNLTSEILEFEEINGPIPNRGLNTQPDVSLFGLTYLQQIQDSNLKAGLHVEPGIWVVVPESAVPAIGEKTVARMASIPHGTTINAQGTSKVQNGKPVIPPVSITPFVIGQPGNLVQFPESNLATPSNFRSPAAQLVGITQSMLDNPNSVLTAAIANQTILSTTTLSVSTQAAAPIQGGGTDNIGFLGPNAQSAEVDATFWLEEVSGGLEFENSGSCNTRSACC